MGASHHESPEEAEIQRRLLDQFLNRAKPEFPAGRISNNDQGSLAFAVACDLEKKAVVIRFGKPVDWLGLGKPEALHLASLLIERAKELP